MPLLFQRAKLFHKHRRRKSVRGDVRGRGESPVLPVYLPGVLYRYEDLAQDAISLIFTSVNKHIQRMS